MFVHLLKRSSIPLTNKVKNCVFLNGEGVTSVPRSRINRYGEMDIQWPDQKEILVTVAPDGLIIVDKVLQIPNDPLKVIKYEFKEDELEKICDAIMTLRDTV